MSHEEREDRVEGAREKLPGVVRGRDSMVQPSIGPHLVAEKGAQEKGDIDKADDPEERADRRRPDRAGVLELPIRHPGQHADRLDAHADLPEKITERGREGRMEE